jgi:hypothetical protein
MELAELAAASAVRAPCLVYYGAADRHRIATDDGGAQKQVGVWRLHVTIETDHRPSALGGGDG